MLIRLYILRQIGILQINDVTSDMDLAKVFDKVPHGRLVEKLRKHGIGGKLLRTIDSWLRSRRQTACIKGLVGWLMSFASITVGLLCRMLSNCRCNSSSRLRS